MACWCVRPWRDSPFTSNISSPERWRKKCSPAKNLKIKAKDNENPHAMWLSSNCFDDNCSKCIGVTVSWSGVSIYLLSASHLLQLLHWGKWSWRIYPSSPGLNPAHRQYWSRDPRHKDTSLWAWIYNSTGGDVSGIWNCSCTEVSLSTSISRSLQFKIESGITPK